MYPRFAIGGTAFEYTFGEITNPRIQTPNPKKPNPGNRVNAPFGFGFLGFGLWDLRKLIETFSELDVGAPRVDDEGDVDAEGIDAPEGDRRLNALSLDLREELLQVLDLEANVIDSSPGGSDRRRG